MAKMKAYATFDLYLADQSARNRPILRAVRTFVARVAPKLRESVKWGNGCWLGKKEPVCYVYSAPDHVHFGFFRGSALTDRRGILQGDGQYVRHVKLRTAADLDEAALGTLVRAGERLEARLPAAPPQRRGRKAKTKPSSGPRRGSTTKR